MVVVDSSKGGGGHIPRATNNKTASMEGRRAVRWMEDCTREYHHHPNDDDVERHYWFHGGEPDMMNDDHATVVEEVFSV